MTNKNKAVREVFRQFSNNPANPNKNLCSLAVAEFLNVDKKVRFLHTQEDLIRAVKKSWKTEELTDLLKAENKGFYDVQETIKGFQNWKSEKPLAFIIFVNQHVLMLKQDGSKVVDTDFIKTAKAKVIKVVGVHR